MPSSRSMLPDRASWRTPIGVRPCRSRPDPVGGPRHVKAEDAVVGRLAVRRGDRERHRTLVPGEGLVGRADPQIDAVLPGIRTCGIPMRRRYVPGSSIDGCFDSTRSRRRAAPHGPSTPSPPRRPTDAGWRTTTSTLIHAVRPRRERTPVVVRWRRRCHCADRIGRSCSSSVNVAVAPPVDTVPT